MKEKDVFLSGVHGYRLLHNWGCMCLSFFLRFVPLEAIFGVFPSYSIRYLHSILNY